MGKRKEEEKAGLFHLMFLITDTIMDFFKCISQFLDVFECKLMSMNEEASQEGFDLTLWCSI